MRAMARASTSVVGSGTVGPEPITAGSSPGTSEMPTATSRAGRGALRQPAALDAGQMLAHRIDLGDRGARRKQRARHGLLLVEREAPGGRDPIGGRAAGDEHQDEIVCAGRVGQRERLSVSASPAASGTGWPASTRRNIRVGRP